MGKAILISIQPKWCKLIISGKKTEEIRKTRPKLETPFKAYIYCTKSKKHFMHSGIVESTDDLYKMPNGEIKHGYSGELMLHDGKYDSSNFLNGKVIGEFICDKITYLGNVAKDQWKYLLGNTHEHLKRIVTENACLTEAELLSYGGRYSWKISNLVIYDRPQELNYFVVKGDCDCMNCKKCSWFSPGNDYNVEDDCNLGYENIYRKETLKPLFRPPQSWCYVEE